MAPFVPVTFPRVFTLHFDKGMALIPRLEDAEKIERVGSILGIDPKLLAFVTGHASSEGEAGFNRNLSQQRAFSIRSLLGARGVPFSRIFVAGLGTSKPAAAETARTAADLEEQRKKNRRAEIFITPAPLPPLPGSDFTFTPVIVDVVDLVRDTLRGKYPPFPPQPPPNPGKPGKLPPDPGSQLPQTNQIKDWQDVIRHWNDLLDKLHLNPDPLLDMLKDRVFPSDTEGPFDADFERDLRRRRQTPPQPPDDDKK